VSGDNALAAGEIQTLLASYGIKNDWRVDVPLHDVFDNLVMKKPMIALIHYEVLVRAGLTQKTAFLGRHFVVITGVSNAFVYIHDPYRDDGKGENIPVPVDTFVDCWKDAVDDGNPAYAILTPRIPIVDLSVSAPVSMSCTTTKGVWVLSGPGNIHRATSHLPIGARVDVVGFVGGWVMINMWHRPAL
jgi:hypothetical protein